MQHHMDVRAAVADVDDAVLADLQFGLQLVEHCDLSVTRGDLKDGLDLPGLGVILKTGAEYVLRRHDVFEGGLDYLYRGRRNHIEMKPVALDPLVEDF